MSRSSPVLSTQLLRPVGSSVGGARELLIGVLDLFKIGIGPSSCHTIGPMKAVASFVGATTTEQIARISVTVFGSLARTGKEHATDKALALGLSGELPDRIDPDEANQRFEDIRAHQRIELPCGRKIPFELGKDVVFDKRRVFERHPNAMQFEAFDSEHRVLASEVWFSIGGGFI